METRKRYYIGLLPFEDFFCVGGVSAEENKKHSFDNVNDLSYGIFHAYADIVETENGPKIERFGIENGNLKGISDTSNNTLSYVTFKQDTDVFGFFDGKTMETKIGKKTCSSCCDMEMKSLMRTLLNTQIETRVDGISIPAKVVDNLFFIVKDELDAYSPVERTCVIETNQSGKVIKFECILMDNVKTRVVDAHDGYAECVVRDDETEDNKDTLETSVEDITNPCIYASLTGDGTITATVPYEDYDYSTTYSVEPEYFEPDKGEEEVDYDFEADEIDRIKFTRVGDKVKRITIYFK